MSIVNSKVLQMLEKNHYFIIDNAQCGIALINKDKEFLYCNKKYAEALEYNAAEIIGKTFDDITHPEDVGAETEMRDALLAGELNEFKMTKRYISKTGKIIWVKLDVRAIIFEGERLLEITLSQILQIEDPELRMMLAAYKTELDIITKERRFEEERKSKIINFCIQHWQKLLIGAGMIIALIAGEGLDTVMKLINAFTGNATP